MLRLTLCMALAMALWGCAGAPPLTDAEQARLNTLLPTDALLLGEQHDAPEHHRLERQVVEHLAARHALAAVALEMAEQGHATTGLPPGASEAVVRQALAWNDRGWPWATYGPVVMSAVRAGVPVLGANWPAARGREAMRDATLDARLPPAAFARQRQRIADAHCQLLPESQLTPMTRVQIARDRAMAQTVVAALQPGRTVLLIAGGGHVDRTLGVPWHLPPDIQSKVVLALAGQAQTATDSEAFEAGTLAPGDLLWRTPARPPRDHCAELQLFKTARPAAGP